MSTQDDAHRKHTAHRGEDEAADFLRANGWTILDRNWFCRGGELDLVAEKDDVIAFVEVRTAAVFKGRRPEDSVRGIKRHRIIKAAQKWMTQSSRPLSQRVLRFDVIGIEVQKNGGTRLRHHPAAFTASILF